MLSCLMCVYLRVVMCVSIHFCACVYFCFFLAVDLCVLVYVRSFTCGRLFVSVCLCACVAFVCSCVWPLMCEFISPFV